MTTMPLPLSPPDGTTALDALASLRAHGPPGGARAPIPTGFAPLDEVLNGGLRAGDLVLLGGKPGQGKTTAALQWARQSAAAGSTTVFACYEHDVALLLVRLLLVELGQLAGS